MRRGARWLLARAMFISLSTADSMVGALTGAAAAGIAEKVNPSAAIARRTKEVVAGLAVRAADLVAWGLFPFMFSFIDRAARSLYPDLVP